ncbi:ATP-binding protein [Streptomyces sp. NPDC051243]|uniref:ATP-binding protein n=1 Tax=Streptomyces sp. NPDC051243 TaxID=3365646 RepID=UPI0037AFB950
MTTDEVGVPRPRRPRGFTVRWPFRRKLNLLVGVPLTVVAALLAYLIADQTAQSRNAADAARLVRESAEVATLVDRLAAEHQQAVLLSVRHEAAGVGTPSSAAYRTAQSMVDAQIERVRDAFGDRLPETEAQALRGVEGLSSLRDTVERQYLPAENIDPAYTHATQALIDGLALDRNPDLATTFTGNLLDSLLRAGAAHSAFETGVFSASTGDSNALIEFIGAIGSYDEYTHQADRFARFATDAQTAQLNGIKYTAAQSVISRQFAELQIDPGSAQGGSPAEIRESLAEALDSYTAYRDQARTRLAITTSLIDQIADRADDTSEEAAWNAVVLLGLALLGFAVWLVLAMLVRRSVVRPVQALTGAAREVADVAERELARVADDDAEDDGPPRLSEIPVTARDEIGELADVFNRVQKTAVALLERQVLSRRNVAEMFGNVGRRVSNLTTRQLSLIDAVERGETDPALLERLYSIDHIAVRLRRNADSLMLLAGIHEADLDAGPTALTNVVRASLGQIEGYQRVELRARTEAMVEPEVIGDLTLMVAELLENAVSFSPEGRPVEVSVANGEHGGAVIVVADHGLGMSPERLEEENARLIRRERLDLVPTKVLGLFVVGTLARRWEITVTLSRTPGGGVTAEVTVPPSLLVTASTTGATAMAALAAVAGGSGAVEGNAPDAASATGPSPAAGALSAPTTGPRASAAAQTDAARADATPQDAVRPTADADGDGPRPLPRRVSRRGAGSAGTAPSTTRTDRDTVPSSGAGPDDTPSVPEARPEPSPVADRPRAEHSDPVPADHARADQPDPSPRARAEQHTSAHVAESDEPPRPEAVPTGRSAAGEEAATSRPLRRRVRGATLRTQGGASAQQAAARQSVRAVDAEAVRAAIEEFEAAVARAHRDSRHGGDRAGTGALSAPAAPPTPHTQDQNDPPEGAEQ